MAPRHTTESHDEYADLLEEEKRLLEIESSLEALKLQIENLSSDVSELVSAWKAANWLVSLVKWTAGIATAFTVIYTAAKNFK